MRRLRVVVQPELLYVNRFARCLYACLRPDIVRLLLAPLLLIRFGCLDVLSYERVGLVLNAGIGP